RIVQEALTNVVKHARTSSCRVLIGFGREELVIEVTDNGAGVPAMAGVGAAVGVGAGGGAASGGAGDMATLPAWNPSDEFSAYLAEGVSGGGHGIIGMRERVTMLGGEFSARPLPGYGFQVSAHIPVPADRA